MNESSKLGQVNKVYETREKSQSLLDHPRIMTYYFWRVNNRIFVYDVTIRFLRSCKAVLSLVKMHAICTWKKAKEHMHGLIAK